MTVGFHQTNFWDKVLNVFRGTNLTAPTSLYAQIHTGDPLAAGTTAPAAEMTGAARKAMTWAAPSSGSIVLNGTLPAFPITNTETISHISAWDNNTVGSGAVWFSGALSSSRNVQNGDTFTLNTCTISFTPAMA